MHGCFAESAVGAAWVVAGVVPTPDRGIAQGFLKRCETRLVLLDRVFSALFRRKDEVFEACAFQTSHREPLDGVVVIVTTQTGVSAFVQGLFHVFLADARSAHFISRHGIDVEKWKFCLCPLTGFLRFEWMFTGVTDASQADDRRGAGPRSALLH